MSIETRINRLESRRGALTLAVLDSDDSPDVEIILPEKLRGRRMDRAAFKAQFPRGVLVVFIDKEIAPDEQSKKAAG